MKQKFYLLWVAALFICSRSMMMAQDELSVATFEDLGLEPETYWFYDPENPTGSFKSGSFTFNNGWSEYGGFVYWDAFAYSGLSIGIDDLSNPDFQFGAVTGKGVDGSASFGVCYYSDFNIPVITLDAPAIVSGVYLTNNLYTYSSIINGDSYSGGPFEVGDYLKVVFTSYTESGAEDGRSVEFYLADYRSGNSAEHYYVKDWQWLDLTSLGEVSAITFTFEGSRSNEWGLLTPAYLCLDNLGAPSPVTNIATPEATSTAVLCNNGKVFIRTSINDYAVNVYSTTGRLLTKEFRSGDAEVDVASLPQGIYLVEIISGSERIVKKVVR